MSITGRKLAKKSTVKLMTHIPEIGAENQQKEYANDRRQKLV